MNERLTIQDLTDLLAARYGMTKKDAEAFVKEFFLLIEEALESEKYVKIKGLGTFKLIDVDSRESVNVNTGERFQIKGHTKVSFTPDINLRDTINKPFAHFETVVLNDSTMLDDTPMEESDTEEETIEQPEEQHIIPDDVMEEVEKLPEPIVEQEPKTEAVNSQYTAEQIIEQQLRETSITPESPKAQPKMEKPESEEIFVSKKEKSPVPYLITIIIVVLLLCGGAILFIYYPDLLSPSSEKNTLDIPVVTQPVQPETGSADTIEKKDTLKAEVKEVIPEVPKESVKTSPAPVYSDSATYFITGTKATHTIKEGETLTKVALHYYGTKAMWPYIVKHNPTVIKNPDNVPYGTTIQIPELTKK